MSASQGRDGWTPISNQPSHVGLPRGTEQMNARSTRAGSPYSSNVTGQPPQQSAASAPIPASTQNSYYPAQTGSNLPTLPGLAHHSNLTSNQHTAPEPGLHPQSQIVHSVTSGFSLPSINATTSEPSHVSMRERERDLRDARDRDMLRHDEPSEHHLQSREVQDKVQEQNAAHHTSVDSVQLHQPVAVGPQIRSAIHGPNGLLGNNSSSTGHSQMSSGQSVFDTTRGTQQHIQAAFPPVAALNINSGTNANAQSVSVASIGQSQQPILNVSLKSFADVTGVETAADNRWNGPQDALTYLDQVKVQFSGEPNVYNQFLDIMKDFKSQAIDTPGVIRRVSELFSGNPNLIQGFNTFLPPGYRIECGTADDPNAIRVTTPMGTSIDPAGGIRSGIGSDDNPLDRPPFDAFGSGPSRAWSRQGEADRSDAIFSGLGQIDQQSPLEASGRDNNAASSSILSQHQQAQNNVSTAAAQPALVGRETASPHVEPTIPLSAAEFHASASGGAVGASTMEKRTPVEFNHAISYVNKIKNRFAHQPEIYKQFLEILQTYQRESKPIQDVYAQVTSLFNGAPDLLDDFKQFLPESAAHAKSVAARQQAEDLPILSNVRGEAGYAQAGLVQQTPRPERMPPIGNFAPTPSAGRDGKRKRVDKHGPMSSSAAGSGVNEYTAGTSATSKNGFLPNKRPKPSQASTPGTNKVRVQHDLPPVEPALVPALPEPLPPSTSSTATTDELAFFDRVKKHLGNKSAMNEFLKLCNLYSQDLIDKGLMVHRAQGYLGAGTDLLAWFKGFVGFDDTDQLIENIARETGSGRVNLNNCRSLGPSYRLLPRRERNKLCSGRDELCNSVLNDDWASHPTWASEDSGFIAHRKNAFEEGLHRIEEERHDYDLYISACERFVQILEPLAVQNSLKTEEERRHWMLAPDFGGQTRAIYRKIIGKIYGRTEGQRILDALITQPTLVVPVLLQRCRSMLEMWKVAQREWEKIWRDQTNRMFWKSLDHLGLNAKNVDKRQFQTKTLQTEVQSKYEQQKRLRLSGQVQANFQAQYIVNDQSVLMDTVHLALTHAEQAYPADLPRLTHFLKEFVPTFFDVNAEELAARIHEEFDATPTIEDPEDESMILDDSGLPRSKRSGARSSDLLRGVLDKNRSSRTSRTDKDSTITSGSRASTPDNMSLTVEEDIDEAMADVPDHERKVLTWLDHPLESDMAKSRVLKARDPYKRSTYNLYGNLQIYCFFKTFVGLYERLNYIKLCESEVQDAVRRAKHHKAAGDLKMVDKQPDMLFNDVSPGANFYTQMLHMFEEVAKGTVQIDMTPIEDTLRRYYLKHGYLLYNLDKLLSALVRFGSAMPVNETNWKNPSLIALFYSDRKKDTTTFADELAYRKSAEKLIKEGDLYRISYMPSSQQATVRILRKDENTLDLATGHDDLLTPDQQWQYYVSSFETFDATEGIDPASLSSRYLERNVRLLDQTSKTATEVHAAWLATNQTRSSESLRFRISLTRFRIIWNEATFEWWMRRPASATSSSPRHLLEAPSKASIPDNAHTTAQEDDKIEPTHGLSASGDDSGKEKVVSSKGTSDEEEDRRDKSSRFMERFVTTNLWVANRSQDEVDKINAEYRIWRNSSQGEPSRVEIE